MTPIQTARTIKHAAVSASTSGNNTLVAAVSGKRICVIGLVLAAASAVVARLESGAGTTALTGVMPLVANGNLSLVFPMSIPGNPWVKTASGALLNLELGGAVQVSGVVVYYEDD